MRKPNYETYRDSEIKWLEYIPEHWTVQRIKEVGKIQYGLSQPPQYLEEGLPLIRATNIERGKLVDKGLVFISPDDVPWERNPALKENDILVVRSGAYTADSAIIPRKYHGSIAGFDMILRPTRVDPKYLSYTLLSNYLFKDQLILSSFRAAQPHLNKEELGTALIALPSSQEQKAIAHYLDTKTAQIDRKIDLLTQKAQRYEELKRSLINETVTRGLDKSVPRKDSAIEWIGEIPEHWQARKIKRLANVKRGASPRPIDDPKYFDDLHGKYGWVRIEDVTRSSKYLLSTKEKLSTLGSSKSVRMKPGNIFLSIAGSVGKPIISQIDCCIHDGFVYFVDLKQNVDFMFYIFNCPNVFVGLGKVGTQLNLNTEIVGGISIPLPPLDEQKAIAEYLDKKTGHIDRIIENINTQIEIQKELRKTLINDVVTGKIKVIDNGE